MKKTSLVNQFFKKHIDDSLVEFEFIEEDEYLLLKELTIKQLETQIQNEGDLIETFAAFAMIMFMLIEINEME